MFKRVKNDQRCSISTRKVEGADLTDWAIIGRIITGFALNGSCLCMAASTYWPFVSAITFSQLRRGIGRFEFPRLPALPAGIDRKQPNNLPGNGLQIEFDCELSLVRCSGPSTVHDAATILYREKQA